MPEFQQYLKNGQCQWSRTAWRLPFRFILATQLVLILVFFKKPIGSWELIADGRHLFFSNMLLLQLVFILGPFARIGLFPLLVMAAY